MILRAQCQRQHRHSGERQGQEVGCGPQRGERKSGTLRIGETADDCKSISWPAATSLRANLPAIRAATPVHALPNASGIPRNQQLPLAVNAVTCNTWYCPLCS
jgi:hypothetical protein